MGSTEFEIYEIGRVRSLPSLSVLQGVIDYHYHCSILHIAESEAKPIITFFLSHSIQVRIYLAVYRISKLRVQWANYVQIHRTCLVENDLKIASRTSSTTFFIPWVLVVAGRRRPIAQSRPL